jgi:hypothetical protein
LITVGESVADTSVEAREIGIARMIQAGAVPLTSVVFMFELQRDRARQGSAWLLCAPSVIAVTV